MKTLVIIKICSLLDYKDNEMVNCYMAIKFVHTYFKQLAVTIEIINV